MTWSNQSLSTSDNAPSAGPRHGHSGNTTVELFLLYNLSLTRKHDFFYIAILVGDSSLFIIFGSTGDSDASLSVLDINSWSWASSVAAVVVQTPEPTGTNSTNPGNDGGQPNDTGSEGSNGGDSSSNAGTIAGAVVGSVVGVCRFNHVSLSILTCVL